MPPDDELADEFGAKILMLISEAVPPRLRKVPIDGNTRLQRDLGIDSLALAALVFRLEKVFGISLSTVDFGAQVTQIRTVRDAVAASRAIVSLARTSASR